MDSERSTSIIITVAPPVLAGLKVAHGVAAVAQSPPGLSVTAICSERSRSARRRSCVRRRRSGCARAPRARPSRRGGRRDHRRQDQARSTSGLRRIGDEQQRHRAAPHAPAGGRRSSDSAPSGPRPRRIEDPPPVRPTAPGHLAWVAASRPSILSRQDSGQHAAIGLDPGTPPLPPRRRTLRLLLHPKAETCAASACRRHASSACFTRSRARSRAKRMASSTGLERKSSAPASSPRTFSLAVVQGRYHHHRDVRRGRVALEGAARLIPVHARHHHIQ